MDSALGAGRPSKRPCFKVASTAFKGGFVSHADNLSLPGNIASRLGPPAQGSSLEEGGPTYASALGFRESSSTNESVLGRLGQPKRPTSQPLCRFFQSARGCRFGEKCEYDHDGHTPAPTHVRHPADVACSYFNQPSGCWRGDACTFRHSSAGGDALSVLPPSAIVEDSSELDAALADVSRATEGALRNHSDMFAESSANDLDAELDAYRRSGSSNSIVLHSSLQTPHAPTSLVPLEPVSASRQSLLFDVLNEDIEEKDESCSSEEEECV